MKISIRQIVICIWLLILASIIFLNTNATKDFKERKEIDFSKFKIQDLEVSGEVTWLSHTKRPTWYFIKTVDGQIVELPNINGDKYFDFYQFKKKNVVVKGKGYITNEDGVKDIFLEQLLSIELKDSVETAVLMNY